MTDTAQRHDIEPPDTTPLLPDDALRRAEQNIRELFRLATTASNNINQLFARTHHLPDRDTLPATTPADDDATAWAKLSDQIRHEEAGHRWSWLSEQEQDRIVARIATLALGLADPPGARRVVVDTDSILAEELYERPKDDWETGFNRGLRRALGLVKNVLAAHDAPRVTAGDDTP